MQSIEQSTNKTSKNSIIYPTPPSNCPTYLESGPSIWADCVRQANGFGKHDDYNIGQIVEYISFWFPDSTSYRQNHVSIEKAKILSIKYDDTSIKYYELEYCCGRGFNAGTHMRSLRPIENSETIDQ